MYTHLEKTFEKIGAKVATIIADTRTVRGRIQRQLSPVTLNIINNKKGEEIFEIVIRKNIADKLELSVLEVLPKERHLVLLSKLRDDKGRLVEKEHFLCGHDERHLFVATVESVSTVAAAKAALKPNEIRENETGLNVRQRNRRKTKMFKRQGEWFFVPSELTPDPYAIRREEPLVRGAGSKPHIAEFAYRKGGEPVYVCSQHPNGLSPAEYKKVLESDPKASTFRWIYMIRNPMLFVKGRVKHADHATVVLNGWHRVFMNTERRSATVAFLD